MLWIGILLLLASIGILIFGIYISFATEGGAIGQVPVLLYALAFPLFLTMGLAYLRKAGQLRVEFPEWILWAAFPVLVVLSGFLLTKAGNAGAKHHKNKKGL